MIKIGIVGGSQAEIKDFVKQAQKKYSNELEFHVYDTSPDIGTKDLWTYHHFNSPEEMALAAVKQAYDKKIDIIIKGIFSTHTLLKAVLNKEYSLKEQKVLSHVAVMQLPDLEEKILLTDAAMNIAPTTEQLVEITKNVMKVAINIGKKQPKIALLSSAENYNPKMPSSVLAKEVTEHFSEDKQATVYGPLSLDLALSKHAVKSKRFNGPIAGDADVLVVPNIDVGNVLYKALVLFGQATIGGMIVGTSVPIVLTSRSDSTDSKLIGLGLALDQVK